MQGRTLTVVSDVHIHALAFEIVDWQSLVSLCGNVHDSRAKLIALVDVGISCVNEKLDDSEVAMVCCEM